MMADPEAADVDIGMPTIPNGNQRRGRQVSMHFTGFFWILHT